MLDSDIRIQGSAVRGVIFYGCNYYWKGVSGSRSKKKQPHLDRGGLLDIINTLLISFNPGGKFRYIWKGKKNFANLGWLYEENLHVQTKISLKTLKQAEIPEAGYTKCP